MSLASTPLRIFIFDSTRLRSHLFFRYLSTSSEVCPVYHPFLMAAMFGPDHLAQYLQHSEARQKELDEDMQPLYGSDTYEQAATAFKAAVYEAEAGGKVAIANEHWFNVFKPSLVLNLLRGKIDQPSDLGSNPTCIEDDIFETLTPIILIRHPALSVDSIYRGALAHTKQTPSDEDFQMITSNKHQRLLFDWYKARGQLPIVIDAEDILWRTREMTESLCQQLGGVLDPKTFSESWEPTSKEVVERMNPLVYMLTKDIQESRGIQRQAEKVRHWPGRSD
jgi:hypothetical protein